MRITGAADVITRDFPESGSGRSDGIHVSEIVESLAIKLGYLEPDRNWTPTDVLRMKIGQAVEAWWGPHLETKWPDPFIWQPGELEKDGIFGTPDGESLSDKFGLEIHECKVTWLGTASNNKHAKQPGLIPWYWQAQFKSYCAMNDKECTSAVLHRFYVNGNYKPPSPLYWPMRLTFDKGELRKHWDTMQKEADKLRRVKDRDRRLSRGVLLG